MDSTTFKIRRVDYKTATLCFPDGQEFQHCILPKHRTLRDFIEEVFSRLERERKLNLLYHEGFLTQTLNFQVVDSYSQSSLNLELELDSLCILSDTIHSNRKIAFDIKSDLFQMINMIDLHIETDPLRTSVPTRVDSKFKFLLSKGEITFLAGISNSIIRSKSNPITFFDRSYWWTGNTNQEYLSTHSSIYDLHKNLADFGLVKLPLLHFEPLSDATSLLSISSSGGSFVHNSTLLYSSKSCQFEGNTNYSLVKDSFYCEQMVNFPSNRIPLYFELNFSLLQTLPIYLNFTFDYTLNNNYLLRIVLSNFTPHPIILLMECVLTLTVGQIIIFLREFYGDSLNLLGHTEEIFLHNKFTLAYITHGDYYELSDDVLVISTLNISKELKCNAKPFEFVLLEKNKSTNEIRRNELVIGYLISFGLYHLDLAHNDEIMLCRKNLGIFRKNAIKERDPLKYFLPINTNTCELYNSVSSCVRLVKIYKDYATKVLQIDLRNMSPDGLLEIFFDKLNKGNYDFQNFVLRTFQKINFLYGPEPLVSFYCIQKLIIHYDYIIEFIIIPKSPLLSTKIKSTTKEEFSYVNNIIDPPLHENFSYDHHSEVVYIPIYELSMFFEFRIIAIENLHTLIHGLVWLYLEASLYQGGIIICQPNKTNKIRVSNNPKWNCWMQFNIPVKNLPKESRIHFKLYGRFDKSFQNLDYSISKFTANHGFIEFDSEQDILLQSVNFQLFNHRSILQTGPKRLNLWPSVEIGIAGKNPNIYSSYGVSRGIDLIPAGSTAVNPENNKASTLLLEFNEYSHSVLFPYTNHDFNDDAVVSELDPGPDADLIEDLLTQDDFENLNFEHKEILLKYSFYCSQRAYALPKYLLILNWADPLKVRQCHYLLEKWCPISLDIALHLLNYYFADAHVRRFAVHFLDKLSNSELLLYLLQLVQVLKFETYHDSILSRFLLRRALSCKIFGHYYFWYLRSEIGTCEYRERFSVLLEAYLRGCDSELLSILNSQVSFIATLTHYYKKVIGEFTNPEESVKLIENLREYISTIQIPNNFCPLFDPLISVCGIEVRHIKIMDSKKRPLCLVFINNDPFSNLEHVKILVKIGDDLRQDMLTIQMLRIMEKLWLENGLDLHLVPYGCISTGFEEGIIEIIQNAVTVCNIQREAKVNILETFQKEVLLNWLQNLNPGKDQLSKALKKFLFSCAGYCVATYILGIGDRHNDNIMVCEDGNLFHIDFGHFLGNRKRKLGFNREPVPFILTPDFIHVLGGIGSDNYCNFVDIAINAYQIIRNNSNLFITLFNMMKYTGIPELRGESDIAYLHDALKPNLSKEEAAIHFVSLIQKSIENSLHVQISWHFHMKSTNTNQ